ncbi:TPA: glycosyltransferase family 4 protein [Raoultella planticola]|nr:glycosyltransferase family 4 protein [Raoultella planticola]
MTKYREPFFEDLDENIKIRNGSLEVVCGPTPTNFDSSTALNFKCQTLHVKEKLKFRCFENISNIKVESKDDVVIHFADFKYASLYYFLIKKIAIKNSVYLHGQGGYKKKGILSKLVYNLAVFCSTGYICYNEFCKTELDKKLLPFLRRKVFSIDNSLYLEPVTRSISDDIRENKLTFIGRVRPRSGLEDLLNAAQLARDELADLSIEIIGAGDKEYMKTLQDKYRFANFHGAIYTQKEIYSITKKCIAGAYGGDAGLSTVHYMSLGLPVLIHGSMFDHMGPEPSYVVDGFNGIHFKKGDVDDLARKIVAICNNKKYALELGNNALNTFKLLSKPTMAEKLINIINRNAG